MIAATLALIVLLAIWAGLAIRKYNTEEERRFRMSRQSFADSVGRGDWATRSTFIQIENEKWRSHHPDGDIYDCFGTHNEACDAAAVLRSDVTEGAVV